MVLDNLGASLPPEDTVRSRNPSSDYKAAVGGIKLKQPVEEDNSELEEKPRQTRGRQIG